jgi:hypothetical protein
VTRRAPKLESLFIATFVVFGFRLGVRPIVDNSMLTHLRTGMDMVHGLGIPRHDPYSWSAKGADWVVQSWLPEWTYGWAQRIGGFRLVVLEQAVLIAVLTWLLLRLARTGTPSRTALSGLIVVGISYPFWTPRPLLFGLICMALTVVIVERRRSTWLLVPVVWVWVQSHGSFPLGLAWLGARAVGEALDWRGWPREAVSYVGGFAAGLAASVVNPLGARLLTFPLTIADKRKAFETIVEWMSPNFQQGRTRVVLLFIALALVLLVRARQPWRDVVPVVAFLAAGLLAARNLPLFGIVLAPVLSRTLRRPESAPPRRPVAAVDDRMNRAMALVLAVVFVLFGASVLSGDPIELRPYPVEASTFLENEGFFAETHRLVQRDYAGNYLEFRYGRTVPVFIDDRYDMYPLDVSLDYGKLLHADPEAIQILDDRRIDVVLWNQDSPLPNLLKVSGRWDEIHSSGDWVVLRRIG